MSRSKRRKVALHGPFPKTTAVGMKDRATGKVSAKVVPGPDAVSMKTFVISRRETDAMVFTDEHVSYKGLRNRVALPHSHDEYIHGEVHTNGIESHWSMLKRGIFGTTTSARSTPSATPTSLPDATTTGQWTPSTRWAVWSQGDRREAPPVRGLDSRRSRRLR